MPRGRNNGCDICLHAVGGDARAVWRQHAPHLREASRSMVSDFVRRMARWKMLSGR
jgi:hypothetical protein